MPERLDPVPGQTIGPFFHYALPYPGDRELVPPGSTGAVQLFGFVHDGNGDGLQDALLEIRQAGPDGEVPRVAGSLRRDGRFTGWGRSSTDRTGRYWFSTLEPGPAAPDRPAFFAVTLFARGLLNRLFTRIYVPGEHLDADPFLNTLGEAERERLVATRTDDGSLRFDIHLQGPRETPFLVFPRHREPA